MTTQQSFNDIRPTEKSEELQAAFSEAIKQRDQAREHYDRIQRKCHLTEMELKKAFGKIEVLSIDNETLKSDRDNAWSKAVDLKKEVNKLLEFINALEKENGELREEIGSLMVTTEIMQREINKFANTTVLANERDEARAEVERLKLEPKTVIQQMTSRPEPSRLEIAAMLLAHGWADRSVEQDVKLTGWALAAADKLIAAAKLTKKCDG